MIACVHERDQKRWRRERSEFQRTIGELGKKNAALDRRCGVLRLAIPPEAREAAEAALPVDDDVALVLAEDEARRATGEHLPLDDEGHGEDGSSSASRQEQTQARQLAEARAALRRARQNATIAYSAAAKPTQAKRSRSPGPGASRPRAGKALVPRTPTRCPRGSRSSSSAARTARAAATPGRRPAAVDGRLRHADTLEDAGRARPPADEAARARAAERDARSAVAERRAQDKAAHRSWLNGERVKYKQRQTLEKQRQSETLNALMAGRNYAKPWQVNAQLAPRAAAANDADAERKRGDYDWPWRVPRRPRAADAPAARAAKADQPPPPPGSRFSDVEIAEEIAAREAIGASTKSCRASLDGEYDANDENRTPQIPS
ncbi:hypothetical protein JL722_11804 [Aureococcus anophagefferens]|nr:hypothetical protein JL722_11804 [Aureococcus anophagefferens]